jgi:fluoride exporter
VCVGGAAGSAARYGVALASARLWGTALWGTLTVNVLGSFLLALLVTRLPAGTLPDAIRLALGMGLLGGFTTYSTFNHELLGLLQRGALAQALMYAAGTFAGGLLAGAGGWWLARVQG